MAFQGRGLSLGELGTLRSGSLRPAHLHSRESKSALNDPARETWGQSRGWKEMSVTGHLLSDECGHTPSPPAPVVMGAISLGRERPGEAFGLTVNVRTWVLKQSLQECTPHKGYWGVKSNLCGSGRWGATLFRRCNRHAEWVQEKHGF